MNKGGGPGPVTVSADWAGLELQNVDAKLDMKGGWAIDLGALLGGSMAGTIMLGDAAHEGITGLTATGNSRTGVALGLQRARVGVEGLVLGGASLDVGLLEILNVHDSSLTFGGGKPRTLQGTIGSAHAENVKVKR
jgi:hypothetical protein